MRWSRLVRQTGRRRGTGATNWLALRGSRVVDLARSAPDRADAAVTLRIASLVPSLTELIVELGLRDCLIARTGFCIHPADAVRNVPKVGTTVDRVRHTVRVPVLLLRGLT